MSRFPIPHSLCRASTLTLAAGLAAALGAAPVALGQNALGDGHALDNSLNSGTSGYNGLVRSGAGRALDNNLRQGSGGWNGAGQDFGSEIAYRNAIVTGNVGAGREFRGSVGYTAADDFRGFLGSNATFRFERDSFYSGLATRNLSGMDAIRNPLAYTVAGQRDTVFAGGLIINRAGVGTTAGVVDRGIDPRTPVADMFGNIAHSLRSPSFQVTQAQQMPEVIAVRNDPNTSGVFDVMSASPLIGIRSLRSDSPLFNPIQSESASDRVLPGTTLPGMGDPDAEADRIETNPRRSSHEVVLDKLRTPVGAQAIAREPMAIPGAPEARPVPVEPILPGDDTDTEEDESTGMQANMLTPPKFDQNLENLRALLLDAQLRPTEDWMTEPETPTPGESTDGDQNADDRAKTAPELAAEILAGKSVVITEFVSVPTEGNVFAAHMRRGQELLEEGRWFDAEERFTAALAVRPGDPIAAAARVHTQIAAGMYRSATVNIRNLLRAYPEMIVTRFDEALVGSTERTDRVKEQLRKRSELSTVMARDCALLLAYLGYQTQDAQTIDDAFGRIDRIVGDMDQSPDELELTLRELWLTPDAAAPTPPPVPAP